MAAKQKERSFEDLPVEFVADVMKSLSFVNATNLRKSCTLMDTVFIENRDYIKGPECDVHLIANDQHELEIKIENLEQRNQGLREVPEESWENFMVNVECKNLYINMKSRAISNELISEVLSSWELDKVHINGETIEENNLRCLEGLGAKSLIVNFDNFECNEVETTKITNLTVKNRFEEFYEVIEKNKELNVLKVSINWSTLTRIVPLLEAAQWKQNNIASWEIDVYGLPDNEPDETRSQLMRFAEALFKISIVEVDCSVEDFFEEFITICIDKMEKTDDE